MKKIILSLAIACLLIFAAIGAIWGFAPSKVGEITLSFACDTEVPAELNVPLYESGFFPGAKTWNKSTKMPDAPTKEGHTFVAWVLNGVEYKAGAYVPAGLTTDEDGSIFTAKWAVNNYKITFDTNSDVASPSIVTVEYGQIIPELADLQGKREYYDFLGWYTDTNDSNTKTEQGDTFTWTSDITLYALWKLDPNADMSYPFVINFLSNIPDVSAPPSIKVNEGDDLDVLLPDAETPGRIFTGWYIGLQEFVTIGDCHDYLYSKKEIKSVIVLFASWTIDTDYDTTYPFIIRFTSNIDDVASPPAISVNRGDDLTKSLPTLSKSGWTFIGWSFEDNTYSTIGDCHSFLKANSKKSILLTGNWEVTPFVITLDANNPKVTNPAPITVDDSTDMSEPLPQLDTYGYTFVGWFAEDTELKTVNDCFNYASSKTQGDIDIIAKWERNPFTVSFISGNEGIDNPTALTVSSDTPLEETLPSITAYGYTFVGWFIDATQFEDFNDCHVYSIDTQTNDVTLTGVWELIPFTVSFDTNHPSAASLSDIVIDKDTTLTTALDTLSTFGYTFCGWFIETTKFETLNDCLAYSIEYKLGDLLLKGEWTRNPFTISFDAVLQNVTNPDMVTVNESDNLEQALPTLNPLGYTFLGWYISDTKFVTWGDCFAFSITAEETNVALEAKWEIVPFTIQFISGLDGVSNPAELLVDDDSIMTSALTPLSTFGYTFLGWYIETVEFETLYDCFIYSATNETDTVVLTGEWERSAFTISFESGNANVLTPESIVVYHKTPISTELPELSTFGYTFLGWFDTTGTIDFTTYEDCFIYSIANSNDTVELIGKWEIVPFTIDFISGNANVSNPLSATVNKDSNLSMPLDPASTYGYNFIGWYNGTQKFETLDDCFNFSISNQESNITLTGVWELIDFVVSFTSVHGAVPSDITVTKNSNFFENLIELTTTDWVFNGWFIGTTEFMNLNDCLAYHTDNQVSPVTLEGKWTIATYTFIFEITNSSAAYFTALGVGSKVQTVTVNDLDFNVSYPAVTTINSNWTFSGWKFGTHTLTSGNVSTVKALLSTGIRTANLTAEFVEAIRTITFDTKGKTSVDPLYVTSANSEILLPDLWVREPVDGTSTNDKVYCIGNWYYNSLPVRTVGDVLAYSGTNTNLTLEANWVAGYDYYIYIKTSTGQWYQYKENWVKSNNNTITIDTTLLGSLLTNYAFAGWAIDGKAAVMGSGANNQISFTVTKRLFYIDAILIQK